MKKTTFISSLILTLSLIFSGCNKKNQESRVEVRQQRQIDMSVPIFPLPLYVAATQGEFNIDKNTFILEPEGAGASDSFLADLIFNEFVDKYEYPVKIIRKNSFTDADKYILIGDLNNPLVKKYCSDNDLLGSLKDLGKEGYILSVKPGSIVVAANEKEGALYGLESLRQIISKSEENISVRCMEVKDAPRYEFRGIKLYLPGRENITFFKRFIKDFAALYKFNKIILELNANMRLEKHPELNIGTVEFKRHLDFSRLGRPPGQHQEYQNSSHQDNADGDILEKEEVADLVNYIRKFNIEVIPELPSLTHSYYLLFGHKDLAENLNQPYPDTYCPLKPEIYNIYFDVLDEYIDVIHPAIIHIGHDEWRMEKDVCDLCRGRDYGELYAGDLIKIHDYLAKKGIQTAMWGDHLLESVTQKDHRVWKSSAGYEYKIPGAMTPEQVSAQVPKDILVFNWFWDDINNDRQLSDFGFTQVYGNLRPDIDKWDERYSVKGVMGGAPSSWAATTELNIGKDQLLDFLGCANLLWSEKHLDMEELTFHTEPMIRELYKNLSGRSLPSDEGCKIKELDISSKLNSKLNNGLDDIGRSELKSGELSSGNMLFSLVASAKSSGRAITVSTLKNSSKPSSVNGIMVNSDPNSILFLHACAREGINKKAYDEIYNFDETSELLGWYEVIYEDGFVETIPIRYGLNILDMHWKPRVIEGGKPRAKNGQNRYAYKASAVECSENKSEPLTFYAFEWVNPRFGKTIKEINLKSVNFNGDNENAIILLGISITENKQVTDAKGTERF